MNILAIDPGSVHSAYFEWDGSKVGEHGKIPNLDIYRKLKQTYEQVDVLVIEKITLYQRADQNIHDTIFWYGRFVQQWKELNDKPYYFVPRSDVKKHLLPGLSGKDRKDGTIISVLKDRFGQPGTKRQPGFTYGIVKDEWQAFALAVTWYDAWCELQSKVS